MRAIALAASVSLALVGCKKDADQTPSAAPAAAKPVIEGPTAKAEAAALPPAGVAPPAVEASATVASMWNLPINTLRGQPMTLAKYQGQAILVVNVASKCGLTPQYATLEALQEKYAAKGFTVLGFPCNQFGGQEPGSAEQIEEFCSTTYGVSFPMTEKIEVNGEGRHAIYKALTPIADADGHTGDIRWNFEKFLISADGKTITRFSPKTTPDDPALIAAVEAALPK
ncbi:MAG: glutathione peroxidase [Kofleriaceae bacterium]